jgi:hypothetical protein
MYSSDTIYGCVMKNTAERDQSKQFDPEVSIEWRHARMSSHPLLARYRLPMNSTRCNLYRIDLQHHLHKHHA